MRNLKRALSLAMASVMLLGMMVVGTGASYKDVTSKENKEAIEVLQAVGVMVGDEKGNFNPDQNVTRNEMAVVMANLMDYRVASYSGTSPFTDVPSWAEPYVAACYTNGITSGMSATTYGGNQTVTAAQAALMLMKALGYFQYQSDFGDDWQLATVSQANKIDLFDGVKAGVREAMTRNDLAQLVLNTLMAGTVEADDSTIKVDTGDVVVEAGKVKYNYITSGKEYADSIDSTLDTSVDGSNSAGSIVQLGEKLYQGDLKRNESSQTSGFNAPAVRWSYNAVEVGTYAKKADYTFEGKVKSSAMYDAVGKTAAKEYDWNVYLDGDRNDVTLFDRADVAANNSANLDGTDRGTTTYVYVNDDAKAKTVTVCIVSSYAAEIVKSDDGTITLDDADLKYDIEGYDEEDVVLYTKSYDGANWTVESVIGIAERVEGVVTKVKNTDSIVIDDTTYNYNSTIAASDKITIDSYDENVAVYLDAQGNIVRIGEATESNDYAYVISIGYEEDKYGSGDVTCYAKMVLTDGTILKVELDDNDYTSSSDAKTKFENKIVSYSEENGVYSLSAKSAKIDSATGLSIKGGSTPINGVASGTVYGDKNTVYLICEDAADDDYNVYVGYNNVPDIEGSSATKAAVYAKDGVAKVVYMTNVTTKSSAEDVIFVVGDPETKQIKSSAGNYYEFKAVVKGESTTIMVKEGSDAAKLLVKGTAGATSEPLAKKAIGVFFGMTESGKGLVTDLKTALPTDVKVDTYTGTKRVSTSSGLVGFGYSSSSKDYTKWLGADEDAVVAYYDFAGNSIDSVGTINSLKTDTDDIATVVTDNGSIIAVFVTSK